jgi:hypothetical protein
MDEKRSGQFPTIAIGYTFEVNTTLFQQNGDVEV